MLILDKRRLESSCSGLINCLWYVLYKKDACLTIPIFSLCVNQSRQGKTSCPTPNSTPASPTVPVGSNKEGRQGKGQA